MRETLVSSHAESYGTAHGRVEVGHDARFESRAGAGERYEERYEDRFERSHEQLARIVAYFGPYIFWATVGAITAAGLVVAGLLS